MGAIAYTHNPGPYEALAAAITRSACDDYLKASYMLRTLKNLSKEGKSELTRTVKECREYFLSEFFRCIMGDPGEEYLGKLDKEVEKCVREGHQPRHYQSKEGYK